MKIMPLLRELHNYHVQLEPERFRPVGRDFTPLIDSQGLILVTAYDNDKAIGLALGNVLNPSQGWVCQGVKLLDIFVREEYRGQGVGHTLLSKFKEEAKKYGAECLRLSVVATNLKAMKFYKREGLLVVEHTMEVDLD